MKTICILLVTVFSFQIQANSLKSYYGYKDMSEILHILNGEKFLFKGRKILSGYNSTQSCAYVSDKAIIVENYCYPVRNYPARSLTLISLEFGVVELYEETGGMDVRSITQSTFPEDVQKVFPKSFQHITIDELDIMLETLYRQYNPACWAIKRDQPSPVEGFNCFKVPRDDYAAWLDSLMGYVLNKNLWDALYVDLKSHF